MVLPDLNLLQLLDPFLEASLMFCLPLLLIYFQPLQLHLLMLFAILHHSKFALQLFLMDLVSHHLHHYFFYLTEKSEYVGK